MLKPKMVSGYIEAGQVAATLMTKSGNIYTGICIDTACSLYCPKCKQETLIKAKELHITVIKEPDA